MSKYLKDVPDEHVFKMGDKSVKNLSELLETVKVMSREEFKHYVGEEHNHFVSWIRDVIKDEVLAGQLNPIKTQGGTVDILENRIKTLSQEKAEHVKVIKVPQPKKDEVSDADVVVTNDAKVISEPGPILSEELDKEEAENEASEESMSNVKIHVENPSEDEKHPELKAEPSGVEKYKPPIHDTIHDTIPEKPMRDVPSETVKERIDRKVDEQTGPLGNILKFFPKEFWFGFAFGLLAGILVTMLSKGG